MSNRPAKEIVAEYKELFENLNKFENTRNVGLADIRRKHDAEIERIQNVIYELENEIDEVEREREDECEEFFAAINVGKIQPTMERLFELNHMFNVLTGRVLTSVDKLGRGDFFINKGYNKDIYFYDEFYDSEALSLRAVIVGDLSPFKETTVGDMGDVYFVNTFSLYVVGLAENSRYSNCHASELECEKGNLDHNVKVCVAKSENLEELKALYFECIKGDVDIDAGMAIFNENNFRDVLNAKNYVFTITISENEKHEFNVYVKNNYKIEDFAEIIAYVCPECKDVFYTIFEVKNAALFGQYLCHKCDSKLVKFKEF